jgi:hypothetical protein
MPSLRCDERTGGAEPRASVPYAVVLDVPTSFPSVFPAAGRWWRARRPMEALDRSPGVSAYPRVSCSTRSRSAPNSPAAGAPRSGHSNERRRASRPTDPHTTGRRSPPADPLKAPPISGPKVTMRSRWYPPTRSAEMARMRTHATGPTMANPPSARQRLCNAGLIGARAACPRIPAQSARPAPSSLWNALSRSRSAPRNGRRLPAA